MARFSAGDEEEEEATVIRCKRRRDQRVSESKFEENQDELLNGEEKNEKNEEISVTIDPDALECSICCEPLRPPLYQCQNGHVACSVCCTKFPNDKCPTCSHSVNFSRCRALEKVIESIKSSCCYSIYGCKKTLPYTEISLHQVTCTYAPCFCPMPNCIFCGSPQQVSTHFCVDHHGSAIDFWYEKQFEVGLKRDQPFAVLHEQDGLLFLLLNEKFIGKGNALSIACIQPSSMDCNFMYELIVNGDGGSLQLKACATNVRKWAGIYSGNVFLFVPQNFCFSSGEILNVCIHMKKIL